MYFGKFIVGLMFLFFSRVNARSTNNYWIDRAKLIQIDEYSYMGSDIVLSEAEQKANAILMAYKNEEISEGFKNPSKFLAAQNFLTSKKSIDKSDVFKIIKNVPKGTSLHSHDMALTSGEFLHSITLEPNLYANVDKGQIKLRFFAPEHKDSNWKLVSELRRTDPKFDALLKSQLTLIVDKPDIHYPDINSVWAAFSNIFITINDMLSYKPVWQKYFYEALKELYEDNVRYLEFRGVLPVVYDLDGKTYNASEVVSLYYETLMQFKEDYPDFWGARFIYAPRRLVNNQTMSQYMETFFDLKKEFPDFIAGFDLVGQEDLGQPLESFIEPLLTMKKKGVNFFFHAGETNWNGCSSDFNLFDAILLNTSRIGHGYAILKHPALSEIVKTQKIAIEVSPISNQVLKLVKDIRNHPATSLIANNYPVVITCDDPSFWGAKGLSYDWYMAFMGLASRSADLRFLKKLAINSIVYSTMEIEERIFALQKWQNDWNTFINNLLIDHNII